MARRDRTANRSAAGKTGGNSDERSKWGGKHSRQVAFWLLMAALILVPLSAQWPLLQQQDRSFQDWLMRQRAQSQLGDSRIVVVDIDDASLKTMVPIVGRWPWPRSVHAELLEFLLAQNVRAVTFDILFSEQDIYRPDADAYFGEVLSGTDRVYLAVLEQQPHELGRPDLLTNYPAQLGAEAGPEAREDQRAMLLVPRAVPAESWRVGSINFTPDIDGVGRRYDIFRQIGGWRLPSLPARIVKDIAPGALEKSGDQQSFLLDWQSSDTNPYTRLSYAEIYRQAAGGESAVKEGYFSDKIVVIGSTASGLHDIRATPIDKLYPAVFILATAIDNLLHGAALRQAPVLLPMGVSMLLVLAVALPLLFREVLLGFVLALVTSGALFGSAYLAVMEGWLLQVFPGVVAIWLLLMTSLGFHYLFRYRELRHTINVFNRFLDPVVVRQLVAEQNPQALLANKSCRITVLFSDIRNFTKLSEMRTADEVVTMLDRYFSKQVDVIFRHGGTLDKFIGDAVMAFWGAPIDNDRQERAAVAAAMEMVTAMEAFKAEHGYKDFDIGIGIHTGNAVVGMVGSQQRSDYTAVGDTVNLASRIEGLTKGRCHILISEETRNHCQRFFDFSEHGEHKVKGREETVNVYEPRRKSRAE